MDVAYRAYSLHHLAFMTTIDIEGWPNCRPIVVRTVYADNDRIKARLWFNGKNSTKAQDLRRNPHCSLCWYWPQSQRVIRMSGTMIEDKEKTAKLVEAMDPVEYRINCATRQSEVLNGGYQELIDTLVKAVTSEETPNETDDRRNCQTSVWHFTSEEIEFWSGGSARFHSRFVFRLENDPHNIEVKRWKADRLWP